jgi:HEAT repeat protein
MINGTALTWNVKPRLTKPLSPQDLEPFWKSLARKDAAKAYAAISAFEAVPETSLPFLKDRLLSAPAIDAKRILELITDLGSERFQVRQAASNELTRLGDKATGYLRQALADNPSLEVRRRVESLLAAARSIQPGEDLRRRRAIQVLEDIGSQRAREILEILAEVSPTTGEAEDAQMTLERLRKKLK